MNYAVIDVGSNSVRLTAYHVDEITGKVDCYLNEREMIGLASYIAEGALSEAGVLKMVNVLKRYKTLIADLNIDTYHVLATASIRNVSNTDAIVAMVHAMTGITLEVLTGEEEAEFDFAGVIAEIPERSGMIVDIGGGSTEMILFEDREIVNAVSIPIGSLQLYSACCENFIPTLDERKEMKKYIEDALESFVFPGGKKYPNLYGIGGTCRSTLRLAAELYPDEQNGEEAGTVSFDIIRDVLKNIKKDLKNGDKMPYLRRVYQAVPERLQSILPGLLILEAIAKRVQSEDLKICVGGVREGYLYRKVLRRQIK